MPDLMRQALLCHDDVKRVAEKYYQATNMLYLGRQYLFPVALEGALKLKEISYIHAEGYPAAEMKHGPIALVDENTPSVFLAPHGVVYDKVMSNLEEIKARGGPVIAIACENDAQILRGPTTSFMSHAFRNTCSRWSWRCLSSFWPITSRCCAALISTSPETWPKASRSSKFT